MKKQVRSLKRKSKIFNSLNIILIALLVVELILVANTNVFTGQPVKSADLNEGETT